MRDTILFLVGCFFGAIVLAMFISRDVNGIIHPTVKVQSGYIAPVQLKIECKDRDGNGEKETVLKIDDIPYLFKGTPENPVLERFEIKLVPKQ